MNILKRELAPITEEGWAEIDEQAKDVLENHLTARKVVDVSGPEGWDFAAVNEGRLDIKEEDKEEVRYGLRQVKPLVESRVSFTLNTWELDNAVRGAEDVDLEPLEEALAKAASFEEKAIYYGLEEAGIEGLEKSSKDSVTLPTDSEEIMESLSRSVTSFIDASIEGPYALVLSEELWRGLNKSGRGYPLKRRIADLVEGPIVYSPAVEDGFLLSTRGGDMELILGQDFSIGYENHDHKTVTLFATESFTFRVLEPGAVLKIES